MLFGKALEDFKNSDIERTNDRVSDYITFFKTLIGIEESEWYDSVLREKVKVFTIEIGENMYIFYNESELLNRLNNDYNQEFD